MPGRVVLIGGDHQAHLIDSDGGRPLALTVDWSKQLMLSRWGEPATPSTAWLWPAWSPDGAWVAAFELPHDDDAAGPAQLQLLSTDGVRQVALLTLTDEAPLYAAWSPDSAGLALLTQPAEGALNLRTVLMSRPGESRLLEQGAPLFFSWAPSGAAVSVHVGGRRDGRVIVRDALGDGADLTPSASPGLYCAPIWIGERLVFVEGLGGLSGAIISARGDGSDAREVARCQGLAAITPAFDGERLLLGVARDGEGGAYDVVRLLDLRTGEDMIVNEDPCLAFFWSAARRSLIYARVDRARGHLSWHERPLGGPARALCQFIPTREQLFHLHYFDQLVLTHPLLTADGATLIFSGTLAGPGADAAGAPQVYALDLDGEEGPRALAPGAYACACPR
ncbi:hypothetical protein L6R49_31325 [Myxococcota bacterium]|nr:hypothetical protein [Myxococcota bacterium]